MEKLTKFTTISSAVAVCLILLVSIDNGNAFAIRQNSVNTDNFETNYGYSSEIQNTKNLRKNETR